MGGGGVRVGGAGLALALLAACTADGERPPDPADPSGEASSSASPPSAPSTSPSASTPAEPEAAPKALPARIDVGTAVRVVRHLAGEIGPRPATSPSYRRAAAWVEGRFRALGYDVRRQSVRVPAGVSWGIPVGAGSADSVIAMRPRTSLRRPHLLVGAHLDTVPQAPGGEDNASGVGVLLAVAEAAAGRRTRLPVVLVAFAAEEPRGPTDDDHHYGSRRYVGSLRPAERAAVEGMLSLDRVGVGGRVPVCAAETLGDPSLSRVVRAARRVGVPTEPCLNRSSDHWSFVRAGLPGVRVGGTSYAAYHSAADGPGVPRPSQLARAGRVVLAWLAPRP